MGRPEEIAAAKKRIRKEFAKRNVESGTKLAKMIVDSMKNEGKQNPSVEEEALTQVIAELGEEEVDTFIETLTKLKVVTLLPVGKKATEENQRCFKLLNEKPTYGLEIDPFVNNWELTDKIIIYATSVLEKDAVDLAKGIDLILKQHPKFKILEEERKDFERQTIENYAKTMPGYKAAAGYYQNATEVLESKPLDFIDIAPDPKKPGKLKVTRIDQAKADEENAVHQLVEKYRKSEKLAMANLMDRVLNEGTRDNKLTAEGQKTMAPLMAYCMNYGFDDEKDYCLLEYKIRNEEQYEYRTEKLQELTDSLSENLDFKAYLNTLTVNEAYLKQSPAKIADGWKQYDKDLQRTREKVRADAQKFINFSDEKEAKYDAQGFKLTIDEILTEMKSGIYAYVDDFSKRNMEYNLPNDILDTAEYFMYKMLSEPGAKRTFFGKGTDLADDEKVSRRNGLVADENGKYALADVEKAMHKFRNNLVDDPMFKQAMMTGKTKEKIYEAYKTLVREKTNSIKSSVEHKNKRFNAGKKKAEIEAEREQTATVKLTKEDIDFLKKTRDELDTLYKSNGKYKSTYMKELYAEMNKVIEAADQSMEGGKDPEVKFGRLEALQEKAVTYFKERKGSIFNPVTDRGKARLDIVEKMIQRNDKIFKKIEDAQKVKEVKVKPVAK